MIYVRGDIPSKLLIKHLFPSDTEGLFVELNFRKRKWDMLLGTYGSRYSRMDKVKFAEGSQIF